MVPASREKVEPILERIARHEHELVARISEAELEAKQIVDAARLETQQVLQDAARELEAELAQLYREAELARERERQAAVEEATERAQRVRVEAAGRIPAIVDEILSLILPTQERGGTT